MIIGKNKKMLGAGSFVPQKHEEEGKVYHCHIHFYFVGKSHEVFAILKEMSPLESFTHEFWESEQLEAGLTAEADVIFADLQVIKGHDELEGLMACKPENAEIIFLGEKDQFERLNAYLWNISDVWFLPMTEEEIRFRFLRWQQTCKLGMDFWQTDQFLDATINHTPSLIWYKDKNGIHEKVNDSFCRTVNKTKQQVEGRGHAYIWDVEHDDPACIESEREVMERKQTFVSEETIKTGEGPRLLTTYKSPLYDVDGSVMGTVGVAIDITQERAYEEEIVQKNQVLETMFTTMDCGVMCHTMDGSHIVSINRAALNILDYESQEELEEAGFSMVAASVMDEDKPKLREAIQELKKEGDSVSIGYRVCRKNQEIRHVMGNVKLIKENGELLYQRFLLDCTEQKLREEEDKRRQMELIQALSLDYNVVCAFDLSSGKGSFLRVEDEGKRIFAPMIDEEVLVEDCLKFYICQFVCEEDREMLSHALSRENLKQELVDKNKYLINYRMVLDGEIKYSQVKAVRVGAYGESHSIVLGFHSVDEEIRREMEKNDLLEDALLQARKANEAKSTFLSNMSHDIRTPMNAIVGFTTLALSHIGRQEQVKAYLGKIMASGNHLLGLINDVLDMSRIESGKMHLDEKPCSLQEVFRDLYSIIQADIHAKGLTLAINVGNLVHQEIYCDKLRLNQVLLNLLSNAAKYTEAGGRITVQVEETPGALADYANYKFSVKDTGIGMSEEFSSHIFEPFEREKNTTISGIQGTGLGMAITKNIVDMMRGSIEVFSEQGVGTEFIVTLTFRVCTAELGNNRKEDKAPVEIHPGNLLLAEDNELNQEIAMEILKEAGFSVTIAENGQVAVDILRNSVPGYFQAVLMDIQMPVMNGYEAVQEIRKLENKELASIPVLAMTANAFEEDKRESLRCGMNGHIPKPIDVQFLFAELSKVL